MNLAVNSTHGSTVESMPCEVIKGSELEYKNTLEMYLSLANTQDGNH